jgi:hypothetical protein
MALQDWIAREILDIHNRLKVDNIAEDIKLYQKKWLDHLKRMDRSRLQKLAFQYQPLVPAFFIYII